MQVVYEVFITDLKDKGIPLFGKMNKQQKMEEEKAEKTTKERNLENQFSKKDIKIKKNNITYANN